MELLVLGPLEAVDGGHVVPLPAGRARALLALLALHAGEPVMAERLIDELWGEDPPPTAATMVHGFVSRLRRALEPGRGRAAPRILQTVPGGYRLALGPDEVDAHRFKALLDQARMADLAGRARLLAEALGLWRGPALADFAYEPFAQRVIATLEELRLVALEERLDVDLALGRHAELVAEAEDLVAAHPFRERLRGHLMLALYRAGRQAEALEAYQAARQALVDALGVEPGPVLRDLEQAILRQDPSLDVPPRPEPAPAGQPARGHWLPRERRTVTVAFAELAAAEDGIDPEALRRIQARALDVARGVLRRHGARVDELVGGLLVGFFGLPVAHEDDAVRAVRAAVELRGGVLALDGDGADRDPPRLSVRVGIETGQIVLGAGGSVRAGASGQVLTAAAHLQQAASAGQVLIGEETQRLVAGAAVVRPVRHRGGPPSTWQVLEVVASAPAIARHFDAPMFGRGAELTRLRTAVSAALRRGVTHRLTILGDPGIGKTKLARELASTLAPQVSIVTGGCRAYGDGITFLPVRQALLDHAGARGWPALEELLAGEDDGFEVADQAARALGLSLGAPVPGKVFPALRRAFEVLAARRPLVVVIEDLHWAEPTLLDFVEYLTDSAAGALFLLCIAREELLEQRHAWGEAGERTGLLRLEPLPADQIEALVHDRAGATVPPDVRRRIAATAQGNPLFAEQLVAAYHDQPVDAVPASLQGLLTMRLDRLGPGERDLLRCASVAGADFTEDALAALLPEQARPFLGRHFEELERMRFIERAGSDVRFRHALIHLTAYQSTTRGDRARLHERLADWLVAGPAEASPDLDEVAGHHLQAAVEQRRAMGQSGDDVRALAQRAGEHLTRAGERAFARFDITAAERLLGRARSMLPAHHPGQAGVAQLLAEANQVLGRHRRADGLLAELLEAARTSGDPVRQRSIRLERARIRIYTSRGPLPLDAIRRDAEEAGRYFAGAGDDGEAAKAWFVAGYAHWKDGRIGAMHAAMSRSLDHAERVAQTREQLAARWMLVRALLLGPAPVASCIKRCEQLAALDGGEHAGVLTDQAIATAMAGRVEAARELNARARAICVERFRARRPLMFIALSDAVVETVGGDAAAAAPHLRAALDLALDMEEWDHAAEAAARLSIALRALGRADEADTLAQQSARVAPADGVGARAWSGAASARTLADRGDFRAAGDLARRALRLVPDEMLDLRADLMVQLAAVLEAADHAQAAAAMLDDAVALYERKGNVSAAARCRAPAAGRARAAGSAT